MQTGGYQSAGGHTGAAGQGFSFDTSLISPNAELVGADDLNEVHIGAARLEVLVPAQFRTQGLDHGLVGVFHEDHGMRYARVDGTDLQDSG